MALYVYNECTLYIIPYSFVFDLIEEKKKYLMGLSELAVFPMFPFHSF